MQDKIADDQINRRGLLKCMTWIGTGLIWTVSGGVPVSRLLGDSSKEATGSGLSFVQISDSHIGFQESLRIQTLRPRCKLAVDKINALPARARVSHPHRRSYSFIKAWRIRRYGWSAAGAARQGVSFSFPASTTSPGMTAKSILERYGKNSKGRGWYSFDHAGVHFIGLNNCVQLEGLGDLGGRAIGMASKRMSLDSHRARRW